MSYSPAKLPMRRNAFEWAQEFIRLFITKERVSSTKLNISWLVITTEAQSDHNWDYWSDFAATVLSSYHRSPPLLPRKLSPKNDPPAFMKFMHKWKPLFPLTKACIATLLVILLRNEKTKNKRYTRRKILIGPTAHCFLFSCFFPPTVAHNNITPPDSARAPRHEKTGERGYPVREW